MCGQAGTHHMTIAACLLSFFFSCTVHRQSRHTGVPVGAVCGDGFMHGKGGFHEWIDTW